MGRNVVKYTTIDLNATGTTTVFSPSNDHQTVYGVQMENPGATAEVTLEVTDGTDTVNLDAAGGAGDKVNYTDPIPLDTDQSIQMNVTKAEGSAGTATAVVFVGD